MRIQVNLSDEILKEVDSASKRLGLTRSAYIVSLIAQSIDNQKTALKMMQELSHQLSQSMIEESKNENDKK